MAIKNTLYPKTKRLSNSNTKITVTEKLDGSNLSFFKHDGKLYIAQRNYIFCWDDMNEEEGKSLYKGLYGWLMENADNLKSLLLDKASIVGEWIGMGKIGYGDSLDHRFYIFAKANVDMIDGNFKMYNILYKHELFIYPFETKEIPPYMGVVPIVAEYESTPSIDTMNGLYEEYMKTVDYIPEGFIVNFQDMKSIVKYVRNKNGKVEPHKS